MLTFRFTNPYSKNVFYTIDIITKNNINGTVLSFMLFSYVDIQTVNKQESVEFLQRSVLPLIFLSGNWQHFVNYFK